LTTPASPISGGLLIVEISSSRGCLRTMTLTAETLQICFTKHKVLWCTAPALRGAHSGLKTGRDELLQILRLIPFSSFGVVAHVVVSSQAASFRPGTSVTKKASGSIGKARRTLRSGFPPPTILSARSMEGAVTGAWDVRALSRISAVTRIHLRALLPLADAHAASHSGTKSGTGPSGTSISR
jgi:hypothetical protein